MNLVKGFLNRKLIYFYSFLLLLIVFLYFNNRYEKQEISYAIIYIIFGMMISLFYILKDFVYNPDRMNYKQVIMEDALFNHRGEIIEEFESYPLYQEFVTFHLKRNSEDPYSEKVTSLQAVRYIKNKMVDSLFIPIHTADPLLKDYTLPLNEAIGRFLRYAGDLPIIIYNQPFTHTYLNIKLDKEVHISFIDAMKMSKDLYGIINKPLSHIQKYLRIYNLESDKVSDAKIIGAIYLDYIYTVSRYRSKEARIMARKGIKPTQRPVKEKMPTPSHSSPSLQRKPESQDNLQTEKKPVFAEAAKPSNSDKSLPSIKSSGLTTKVPEEERRIIMNKETKQNRTFDPKLLERWGKNLAHKLSESTLLIRSKFSQKDKPLDEQHTNDHRD